MADDLDVAIRCACAVALLHPTSIRRAPIGTYFHYDDSRIRLRVSDQFGLDDFAVWAPACGGEWTAVLLCSPYGTESERPQTFLPGDWIVYVRALAACKSRAWLDWRAAHWAPAHQERLRRPEKAGLGEWPDSAALPAM